MTRKDYANYQRTVCNFMKSEGLRHLTTGLINCPECEVRFKSDICPKCNKSSDNFAVEPYPSKQKCDCCGDREYGERLDANSYCESTREIKEYVICPDCQYYAEYGRLDDTAMLEIGKLPEEYYTFDELEVDHLVKFQGKKTKIITKSIMNENRFVEFIVDGVTFRLYDYSANESQKLGVYCYGID